MRPGTAAERLRLDCLHNEDMEADAEHIADTGLQSLEMLGEVPEEGHMDCAEVAAYYCHKDMAGEARLFAMEAEVGA